MRDHRKRGRFAALLLALYLTGSTASCGLVDPCGESRNFDAMIEADSRATGAVDGLVSLTDSRSNGNDQFSWIVFFAPTNSADSLVTDVHLTRGRPTTFCTRCPIGAACRGTCQRQWDTLRD